MHLNCYRLHRVHENSATPAEIRGAVIDHKSQNQLDFFFNIFSPTLSSFPPHQIYYNYIRCDLYNTERGLGHTKGPDAEAYMYRQAIKTMGQESCATYTRSLILR
jgi:hypothetical protein